MLAVLLPSLLMVPGSLQMPAEAYTPADIPLDVASNPTVEVKVSHSPTNPDPKQGDTFTYTMDFVFDRMVEPGTTRTMTVVVSADQNAPFTTLPALTDFSYVGGGSVTGTRGQCSTTECTFTITNMPNKDTLRFTKQAKVSTTMGPGELVAAYASADVKTTASLGFKEVSKNFPWPACSGTYTFVQEVTGGGGWLADIKFADVAGQGKVRLAPGDRTIRPWNEATPGDDTIKVVDGTGKDITAEVMAKATYLANDPSVPLYLAQSGYTGTFANSTWVDSLNWRYDPKTLTGDTWLPGGTVITVTREVVYTNCIPGGFSGDFDLSREFGILIQAGRMAKDVKANGFDAFTMPGRMPPASCVDNIWSMNTTASNNAPSYLQQWRPSERRTVTLAQSPYYSAAIAATDKYPHLVFSINWIKAYQNTIDIFDTSVSPTRVFTPPFAAGSAPIPDAWGAAFDKEGRLWIVPSDTPYMMYVEAADIAAVAQNPQHALTVKQGARLSAVSDIAFDGDGNLWLTRQTISPIESRLGKVPAGSAFTTYGATLPIQWIGSAQSGFYRSLAFRGDKLLLGRTWESTTQGSLNNSIYEVNRSTGALTKLTDPMGYTVQATSDWASCSFPKASDGPAFKVQKSIINPDGSIQEAGTTGAKRTINPDGTLTIDYLVTVTAVGTVKGTFPTVTDTVTVPPGFTVTDVYLDGVRQNSTSTFTIPGKELDPYGQAANASATYKVTVKAKVSTTLDAVEWAKAGTCDTAGAGTPSAGGFFNLVTMDKDLDGPNNNDACAPVTSAQLRLIKQIVNPDGTQVTGSTDSKFFDLRAVGPTPLLGKSATSGAVGAGGYVMPGSYQLSEQGNDGGTTSGQYKLYADWACTNSGGGAMTLTNNTVTVPDGGNVTCIIKNTKTPKVHIVKTAADPIQGNTHIGKMITPNADGTFTATYKITVTNTSGFTTTTGPVWDRFIVPAGLVWDGTKSATVSIVTPLPTGTTVSGQATTLTQAQLANEATLATSINNLPNGASVVFNLSIPLKIDNTVASGQTKSNYELNSTKLAQCESESHSAGGPYTTMAKGIPNVTSIANEDQGYSPIWLEDNVACVPVQATKFKIVKTATHESTDNSHIGVGIVPNDDGTFVAEYTITVTNLSTSTATSGKITDTFTPPAGLVWDGAKTASLSLVLPQAGYGNGVPSVFTQQQLKDGATLATSLNDVPAGGTAVFKLSIPLKLDTTVSATDPTKTNYEVNAATLSQCASNMSTHGPYTDTTRGIPNVTALVGEDQSYSPIWLEDNVACIPVLQTVTIKVHKQALNCDVDQPTCDLEGAEFALFDTDPSVAGATPIVGGLTVDATNKAVFNSKKLQPGTYWLVETKAAEGFNLLATPIKFDLTMTGISNLEGAGPSTVVDPYDTFTIVVRDVDVGPLPVTGGRGMWPFLAAGLLLIAGAVGYIRRFSGLAVAPRRAS